MDTEKIPKGPYPLGKPGEAYQLRISDHILDSVYGHIGITEVKNRLSGWRYLNVCTASLNWGFVNWIFPLKYYVNCPDYLRPGYNPSPKKGPSDEEFSREQSGSRWPHHESAGQKIAENNQDIAAVIKSYFVLLPISDGVWVVNPKFFPKTAMMRSLIRM